MDSIIIQEVVEEIIQSVIKNNEVRKKNPFPLPKTSSFRVHSPVIPVRIIIFDFDDTLLPSSFLYQNKCLSLDANVPNSVQEQLNIISDAVVNLLTVACESSSLVSIITNSETGWVELSSQKFLPRIVPLISKILVLSARSKYEKAHPNSPIMWKKDAFRSILSHQDSSVFKNILNFGDSSVEREAILDYKKEVTNSLVKVVKLVERPSIEQLRAQLDLIVKCFSHLVSYDQDLDLMLTIKEQ
jgi:hypothetical protein